MEDRIVITDSAQFAAVISEIEKSYKIIQDVLEREKNNSKEIDGTDTWNSNAQAVIHDKYIQLIENFGPIDYSLDLYIQFLKKTLEDYRRLEEELEKNMQDFASELDVNN